VKKPIPDKAEVAIEYPDNLYWATSIRVGVPGGSSPSRDIAQHVASPLMCLGARRPSVLRALQLILASRRGPASRLVSMAAGPSGCGLARRSRAGLRDRTVEGHAPRLGTAPPLGSYRNENTSSSDMNPAFMASLVAGSGPRPSTKARSSMRLP
jgi:hypothetical protein